MFEPKTLEPKSNRQLLTSPPSPKPAENGQQRLMVGALVLLLAALGLLLYHDRDFWFPDTQEAEDHTEASVSAVATPAQPSAAKNVARTIGKKDHNPKLQAKATVPATPASPPASTTMQRTALPPLEVEVVAGDSHRKVRPGTNSVHVDMQPGSAPQPVTEAAVSTPADTAAAVTTNAAERVQMSSDTTAIVSHSVRPDYPLLARQMKVQGSVILQALISREGAIQDLHVLSGPPILASAAQEAVRQWRFKPHYLGAEAVETQAKITVNFTISTN